MVPQVCIVRQKKKFCSPALTRCGRPSKAKLIENIFYDQHRYTLIIFVMHKKFEEYTETNTCYNVIMDMDQNKQINCVLHGAADF